MDELASEDRVRWCSSTNQITDTILSLARFKNGGIGLVLVNVDRILLDKRYQWSINEIDCKLAKFTGCVLLCMQTETILSWPGKYGDSVVVDGANSISFCTKLDDNLKHFICRDALNEAKILLQLIFSESQPVLPLINSPYNEQTTLFNIITPGVSSSQSVKEKCLVALCNRQVKLEQMRLHVGAHIVRGETTGPVCGFCGTLCGHAVKIKFSSGTGVNRTYKAYSGCKYFSDFSMKSAKSYLKGNPCTNRPIECAICSNVFWSYNLFSHYTSSHSFMECPLKEEKKLMLTK